MATPLNTPESDNNNQLLSCSPAQAAWDAAFSTYRPVREQWEHEYDQAEAMPDSSEKDAAFHAFYKVHLPEYFRARDEFMRVPAPNIEALKEKMEASDSASEEHHDLCLDDIRRLAQEAAEGATS